MSPNDLEALFQRGNALLAEGRFEEALACYQELLRQGPEQPGTLANIGVACAELGRLDEAIRNYDAALRLQPAYPQAHYNRANALRELKRYAEALAAYDTALQYHAGFADAWNNRGMTLMRLGRAADAAASYREALRLRSPYPEALSNLGLALQMLGYVEDAIDHFSAAIRQRPDNAGAHCNLAQAWLLKGDFRRGWPEYEWRWKLARLRQTARDLPRWDGSLLAGRSLLVRGEQGLGDTIQFIRYVPMVKRRGGRVVLECPEALHPLLKSFSALDGLVTPGAAETGCDCQIPLLSLPGVFGADFRSLPADVPYLKADPARVKRWRRKLPKDGRLIGIAWQGNADYPEDGFRSIPLSAFAPLAEVTGVQLVCLQKGLGVEQIVAFREKHSLLELDDLDADGAFLDTAAVMNSLDLVVAADTSIGHLAGALGRPVWMALPVCPEWRWFRDRDDSPWYPTARLFRQQNSGDWAGVFERIVEALRNEPPTA